MQRPSSAPPRAAPTTMAPSPASRLAAAWNKLTTRTRPVATVAASSVAEAPTATGAASAVGARGTGAGAAAASGERGRERVSPLPP